MTVPTSPRMCDPGFASLADCDGLDEYRHDTHAMVPPHITALRGQVIRGKLALSCGLLRWFGT
jgi:hypothetical protein